MENSEIFNIDADNWMTVAIKEMFPDNENSLQQF